MKSKNRLYPRAITRSQRSEIAVFQRAKEFGPFVTHLFPNYARIEWIRPNLEERSLEIKRPEVVANPRFIFNFVAAGVDEVTKQQLETLLESGRADRIILPGTLSGLLKRGIEPKRVFHFVRQRAPTLAQVNDDRRAKIAAIKKAIKRLDTAIAALKLLRKTGVLLLKPDSLSDDHSLRRQVFIRGFEPSPIREMVRLIDDRLNPELAALQFPRNRPPDELKRAFVREWVRFAKHHSRQPLLHEGAALFSACFDVRMKYSAFKVLAFRHR